MPRLIVFGDSIMEGWDGTKSVGQGNRIPDTIAKETGWFVEDAAIGGTSFNSGNKNFPEIIDQYNLSVYDAAMIAYGVNNFSWPGPLSTIKDYLAQGIDQIRGKQPNIKILVELPTQDCRFNCTSLDDKNKAGWSQNDLCDALIDVANQKNCDYYDWRPDPLITHDNASITLGDGATGVHPTQAIMNKMGERLASKLKAIVPDDSSSVDIPPDEPSRPSQPEEPSNNKKTVEKLRITRLNDLFKLGDNVDQGTTAIISKVNELYKLLAKMQGLDQFELTKNRQNPGNALTRILRNYVLLSFDDLERAINNLVKEYNKYWIRNPKTADPTELIILQRPDKLTLDSNYQKVINTNWKMIENKINELTDYINRIFKE